MKKTDIFYLIHNYNTVPEDLIAYCSDYLILDASDDEKVRAEIKDKNLNFKQVENTGHNLISYLQFFVADLLFFL